MRISVFCHSLLSDWEHGNPHFLRGVVTELLDRGHAVRIYEPRHPWGGEDLMAEYGNAPINDLTTAFPQLRSRQYELDSLDLDAALDADLVIVHEWNDPGMVRRIGAHCASTRQCRLLFYDTNHRAIADPAAMGQYDLSQYDGVLALGEPIRQAYLNQGWPRRAWTWHEAADVRVFRPLEGIAAEGDVIWIGNWGGDRRAADLREFLLDPVSALGVKARAHGVRYPQHALDALRNAGIEYAGWIPNYHVPQAFAAFRVTVHIPEWSFAHDLPGIPTIRVFEALACGIPLVSAPWNDTEGLFQAGRDYLSAADGDSMRQQLTMLIKDESAAAELAAQGRATVLARHTCAHRVDELIGICSELGLDTRTELVEARG